MWAQPLSCSPFHHSLLNSSCPSSVQFPFWFTLKINFTFSCQGAKATPRDPPTAGITLLSLRQKEVNPVLQIYWRPISPPKEQLWDSELIQTKGTKGQWYLTSLHTGLEALKEWNWKLAFAESTTQMFELKNWFQLFLPGVRAVPRCGNGTSKERNGKGSVARHTYRLILSPLGPVEPFHHRAGRHLFPLHAGDAEQLHVGPLDSLCLRWDFHTHWGTKSSWRRGAAEEETLRQN